jgi:hypothetical protein
LCVTRSDLGPTALSPESHRQALFSTTRTIAASTSERGRKHRTASTFNPQRAQKSMQFPGLGG